MTALSQVRLHIATGIRPHWSLSLCAGLLHRITGEPSRFSWSVSDDEALRLTLSSGLWLLTQESALLIGGGTGAHRSPFNWADRPGNPTVGLAGDRCRLLVLMQDCVYSTVGRNPTSLRGQAVEPAYLSPTHHLNWARRCSCFPRRTPLLSHVGIRAAVKACVARKRHVFRGCSAERPHNGA